MGGWTAASRGTAIEDPEVTTMLLGPSSRDTFATPFSIDRPGFVRSLGSNVIEESPGVLRFTLSNPGEANCELRDVGTYRWSKSADGQWLTLDRIADACEIRGQILPGTWQQNVGFSTDGGPGIAVNFKPFLAFTLPAGSWNGNEFADSDTIAADVPTATFKVWKDLDGFVDPCDIDKGVRPIDPGMDAFLEYLETDPRFNVVRRDEYTIDGHRAVEVEFSIGPNIEPPCWAFDGNEDDRRGVLTWVPESWSGGFYNAPIRSRDILVVTEVDGATLTFEAVNAPNGLLEADRETLDTVRFLQELPAPPAS